MKTINSLSWLCWVCAALALALALPSARAATPSANPPDLMTYQGYLVDNNGDPLGQTSPKNYDVVFRIWNDQLLTLPANQLWAEQQTITVDKGYFSALLGEGAQYGSEARPGLSTIFTNATASDRYIGITVRGIGSGGTDVTIAPRLRLLTSPYAFLARNAVAAISLGNAASPQVVILNGSNVGINKANATSALDVNGTATATALSISGAASVNSLTVAGLTTLNGAVTLNGAATLNANLGVAGARVVEFGQGVAGKEPNAGRIGYGTYTSGSLDIVGGGTTGADRKLKVWAEGGTTLTGPVTATSFSGNGTIPIGGIIMWSGAAVPAGWALCDGSTNNGVATPDLRSRFVVGSSASYALKTTGGFATHALTVAEMPSHQHNIYHGSVQTGDHGIGSAYHSELPQTAASLSPWLTGTTGSGTAFSTVPPYYALAFIMRVQ